MAKLDAWDPHFTAGGYSVEELDAMPTLCTGQAADLKVDTGARRVWLSRMTPEDGETCPIQFERLVDGRWESCD